METKLTWKHDYSEANIILLTSLFIWIDFEHENVTMKLVTLVLTRKHHF